MPQCRGLGIAGGSGSSAICVAEFGEVALMPGFVMLLAWRAVGRESRQELTTCKKNPKQLS